MKNIYDIAKEAGVSISSVSRVLNNKSNVTPELRAKVEPVLKKYNYKPSAIARGLVSHSMKTIAVVSVDVRVSHYGVMIYAIEQQLSAHGYRVIVSNTGGEREKTFEQVKNIIEMKVDGIILVGSIFMDICNNAKFKDLIGNIPVVLANGKLDIDNAFSVFVDDREGTALATQYLLKKGCKDIIYIKDMDTDSARRKAMGFVEVFLNLEDSYSGKNMMKTEYGIDGGRAVIKELVASKQPFDALVFGEDLTAVGAMKELRSLGYRIPEDVQVIGYNDSEYAKVASPELTSINNNPEVVGMLCVRLLESLIEGDEETASLTINPELVIRESTL